MVENEEQQSTSSENKNCKTMIYKNGEIQILHLINFAIKLVMYIILLYFGKMLQRGYEKCLVACYEKTFL